MYFEKIKKQRIAAIILFLSMLTCGCQSAAVADDATGQANEVAVTEQQSSETDANDVAAEEKTEDVGIAEDVSEEQIAEAMKEMSEGTMDEPSEPVPVPEEYDAEYEELLARERRLSLIDHNSIMFYDQRNQRISAYIDEVTYDEDETKTRIKDYVQMGEKLDYPDGFPVKVTQGSSVLISDETSGNGLMRVDIQEEMDEYIIYNLIPYHVYRILVVSQDGDNISLNKQYIMPTGNVRYIKTNKVDNVRDLGGWELANGGIFKYGILYRGAAIPSDYVSPVLTQDAATLSGLGIELEVDLRDYSELESTFDRQREAYGEGLSVIQGARYEQNSQSYYASALNPADKKSYEKTLKSLHLIMDAVMHGEAVFFHCAVGADRTGTIAFLLEGLAGVSESDLDKDYELTSFAYPNAYRQIAADNYIKMRKIIKEQEGDTLQQKFYNWFLNAGFDPGELNQFIDIVTDLDTEIPEKNNGSELLIMAGKNDVPVISEDPEDINLFVATNQVGDACYTPLGFDEAAAQKYAKIISDSAVKLNEMGIRLFSMPCPTSVGLLSDYYREKLGSSDQGQILQCIADNSNDVVYNVNIYPILRAHDNEYLYFRTDHHWTALAAYYAYAEFCNVADIDAVPLETFEEFNEGEFVGTYYANAARRDLLTLDEMIAYRPYGNYNMKVKYTSGDKLREFKNPIVDYSDKSRYDKYNTFILGDNYYVDIENKDLPDDAPSCAVIKDSFGDPFSVYLTQNYKHVYVLDYRHFKTPVAKFAEETPINDVIICQSIGVSQTWAPMAGLAQRLA